MRKTKLSQLLSWLTSTLFDVTHKTDISGWSKW